MSETASFVDPVWLAKWGCVRSNAIEYFLHPLNPFRPKDPVSNEIIHQQGTDITRLMHLGHNGRSGPLSLAQAEEEYNAALARLTGEQVELAPPPFSREDLLSDFTSIEERERQQQQAQLLTIRHVLRTNPNTVKVIGIYYIVGGVVYKSPSVRALMKATIARTLAGIEEACDALSVCVRYEPSTGYSFNFDTVDGDEDEEEDEAKILKQIKDRRKTRKRKELNSSKPGERTDNEEEGIRAMEAMNQILVRLSERTL